MIDLDAPKTPEDIPIEKLKTIVEPWIQRTHTKKTPGGGYHLYFLSREKPEAKQPAFNLDYQTNTGKLSGKYVVTNYRYAARLDNSVIDIGKLYKKTHELPLKEIEFIKEEYKHIPESPDTILCVDSADKILETIVQEIITKKLWTPPAKKSIQLIEEKKTKENIGKLDQIIELLKPYVREGTRDELAKNLSGYLYKSDYKLTEATQIFNGIYIGDEEIDHRIDLLERTYEKDKKDVAGIGGLSQLLSPMDLNRLKELVISKLKKVTKKQIDHDISDIDEQIAYYLEYGYNVTDKMIIDSVKKSSELFYDETTIQYYAKPDKDSIQLIHGMYIVNHCNQLFGYDEFSKKQCYRAMSYITKPITKDHYAYEFTNGLLKINPEDNTYIFYENEYSEDAIPKIKFPFKWNPEASGGKIEESINSILSTTRGNFHKNKDLFMKCVGHSCMGTIEKSIFPIIVGPPGTGKSTLLTLLKRFLTYSEVPIPDIIQNDRFSLTPAVGRDINIDDDLQSNVWKGIGKLNTLISGNGGSVEVKGENERILLTTYNTPKLWGGSNALPPVVGDGFSRRMVLILAENIIPPEDMDDSFQTNILNGCYDDNLEWLIYNSISLYLETRSKPFVHHEHKQAMIDEYESKSDPVKTCIETIFEESEDEEDYIKTKMVYMVIKKWIRKAKREGNLFEEHNTPSMKIMRSAMDRAGYDIATKNVYEDDIHTTLRVYEGIKFKNETIF